MNRIKIYGKYIDFDQVKCIWVKELKVLRGKVECTIYADDIVISPVYSNKAFAEKTCWGIMVQIWDKEQSIRTEIEETNQNGITSD